MWLAGLQYKLESHVRVLCVVGFSFVKVREILWFLFEGFKHVPEISVKFFFFKPDHSFIQA